MENNNDKEIVGPARVGIGGPVGSGKTAIIEQLLPRLKARSISTAVITNDLVTREDAKRLKESGLIDPKRVMAVEAGACPHTVIREDPTLNLEAAETLERKYEDLDLILIESGGDNLASTFSLDLVDYWLFVIDVAGGDDIPRKRGPGIVQSDLLVINKTDLAPFVGSDLDLMGRESHHVRQGRKTVFTDCKTGEGMEEILDHLSREVLLES